MTRARISASPSYGHWLPLLSDRGISAPQTFALAVLARGYELKLDLSDFQRGDPTQRWASYDVASRNRILVPNEIREIEGYNPLPGGDKFPEVTAKVQPAPDAKLGSPS